MMITSILSAKLAIIAVQLVKLLQAIAYHAQLWEHSDIKVERNVCVNLDILIILY